MATTRSKKRRMVLHLRIQTKSRSEVSLLRFLDRAIPVYEAPKGIRMRLLRNVAEPTRYIEIVEYDTVAAYEKDQNRVQNDVQMRALLKEWRSLLARNADVETYEEVTLSRAKRTSRAKGHPASGRWR